MGRMWGSVHCWRELFEMSRCYCVDDNNESNSTCVQERLNSFLELYVACSDLFCVF